MEERTASDSTARFGYRQMNLQSRPQAFTFDRYGNRNFDAANTTTLGSCPAVQCNPQIDAANNRFTTGQGYIYDLAGNVIQDAEGRSFVYDGENKQTEVRDQSQNVIGQYFYDGDGKRVKKYVPSTGEATIFVYDASGKLVAEYSTIVEPQAAAKTSYLTTDHLGSPRINTDATGQVTARHDYMPFGEEIYTAQRTQGLNYAGDTVRQRFTSYERDIEADLDYAQARYYNFKHGRFTSVDPLLTTGRPYNPKTWNRYAYVLNNPLIYVDPDGLYECKGSADECRNFRNNLAAAQARLADIEKKYGKNSDEYTKAQKAVDSYGCESKGGNCIGADGKAIEIGKDSKGNPIYAKDTAGNVQVSFDWTGTSPANTSADTGTGIVKVQFGKGNDSNLGLIANEGINSADFQDALKTGTSVSLYQSEKDGLFVQAVFGELRADARGSTYAYFNLMQGQVNYWEKGWEAPDHKAVRAGRESAISKVLTDVYKLSPTDKRPLLTIPKGYKPRR